MMKFLASRPTAAAGLLLAALLLSGARPALAQEGELFKEPFRNYQIAFANGVEVAVRHLYAEALKGRLDMRELQSLAENQNGKLSRLMADKAIEYQEKLVKLNPGRTEKKGQAQPAPGKGQ